MDDKLSSLLQLAWRSVPATDANHAILAARKATAAGEAAARGTDVPDDSSELARSYELVLADDATFESFARDQLPRFVYHLESIGAHLPRAVGVVVCAFAGSTLYFIQAGELIGKVCELLGVSPQELATRHGTGERHSVALTGPKQ